MNRQKQMHETPKTIMRLFIRQIRQRIGLLLLCATATPLLAQESSQFLRFVETGPQTGRVETALTSYQTAGGVQVDLVAAIHVADKTYYQTLNQRISTYDAVLYEMIKIKKTRPSPAKTSPIPPTNRKRNRPSQASKNPRVAGQILAVQMQKAMQSLLKLQSQVEEIDYSPANFVHADMDAATFARLQNQKKENFLTLMLQSALQERRMQLSGQSRPTSLAEIFRAFSSGDSAHSLKWLFARQLDQVELMLSGIDQGLDGKGSVIISQRNQVALNVLDQQLHQPQKRNIAIFYGAAHMPDFEKHLRQRGFRKTNHQWISAWNLQPKTAKQTQTNPK